MTNPMGEAVISEEMIDAALQAQWGLETHWSDGVTEGMAMLMQTKMEKALQAAWNTRAEARPKDDEVERLVRFAYDEGHEDAAETDEMMRAVECHWDQSFTRKRLAAMKGQSNG